MLKRIFEKTKVYFPGIVIFLFSFFIIFSLISYLKYGFVDYHLLNKESQTFSISFDEIIEKKKERLVNGIHFEVVPEEQILNFSFDNKGFKYLKIYINYLSIGKTDIRFNYLSDGTIVGEEIIALKEGTNFYKFQSKLQFNQIIIDSRAETNYLLGITGLSMDAVCDFNKSEKVISLIMSLFITLFIIFKVKIMTFLKPFFLIYSDFKNKQDLDCENVLKNNSVNSDKYIWFMYFIIILIITIFVRDMDGLYNNTMFLTAHELSIYDGYGDPGHFIRAAIDIAQNGWITQNYQWVFNLWPPGFVLLEALIIKIFGVNVPILFVLQLISVFMLTILLTMTNRFLSKYINKNIAFLLPLLILIFPITRFFLLQPLGVSFGSQFSTTFMMFTMLFVVYIFEGKSKIRFAFLAGFSLGLSVYFRSQFEVIQDIFILLGVLYVVVNYLLKNKNDLNKIVLIMILASILATLPWRVYNYINKGIFTMKPQAPMTFTTLVSSKSTLLKNGGGHSIAGRGNMICLVDKSTCDKFEESNMKLLLKTFINNPIKWYSIKYDIIGEYWFAGFKNIVEPEESNNVFNTVFNYLSILILLFVFIMNIKLIKKPIGQTFALVNLSVLGTYMIILTIANYEVRYFYFPKIIVVYLLILLITINYKYNKKES